MWSITHLQSGLDMVMQSSRQGSLYLFTCTCCMNQYHVPIPSFSEIILLFNHSLSIATHFLIHQLSAMLPHSMFTALLKTLLGHLLICLHPTLLVSLNNSVLNQIGYVFVKPVEWHWHYHRIPCVLRLLVHVPGHSLLHHLLSRSIICWVVVWLTHLPAFLFT